MSSPEEKQQPKEKNQNEKNENPPQRGRRQGGGGGGNNSRFLYPPLTGRFMADLIYSMEGLDINQRKEILAAARAKGRENRDNRRNNGGGGNRKARSNNRAEAEPKEAPDLGGPTPAEVAAAEAGGKKLAFKKVVEPEVVAEAAPAQAEAAPVVHVVVEAEGPV